MVTQILSISKAEYEKFRKEANASGGSEICGLIVGTVGSLSSKVDEIRMIRNAAAEKADKGFVMDPQQYHDAILDLDLYDSSNTKQYVGIIHSHYFDYPFPSITDWFGAERGLGRCVYLIYSVLHEELGCYFWNTKEFIRLEYLICETN